MSTAAFSPDGQTVALGGSVPEKESARSGEARVCDLTTGEPLAGGLDVGEVYRWRDVAWAEARRRLGQ